MRRSKPSGLSDERFPGDILVLASSDPLADHYLQSPSGRTFDIQQDSRGELHLSVDGVDTGVWTDESLAWDPVAEVVLASMSPWPQPASVSRFVAEHLQQRGPGRSFTKRDLEGSIDLWAWERRMAYRSRRWLPLDLELDAEGKLQPREHPVRVHPVGSRRELLQAIDLAEHSFPGLHERTGRGPEFYLDRLADEADLQVVAVAERRVVGLALGSLSPDRITAIVGEVAVEPSYRRQGVGRAMLDEIEGRAAARGLLHLALGADEQAAPFYLTCGWQAKVQVTVRGSQQKAMRSACRCLSKATTRRWQRG